ncbi:MAG: WD40 repeat domain-containing protein, partial [Bacteroidia bacterium]|nr:WD40 repeat domain-containing protein [Bacteroidia bacterium]
KMGKEEMDLLHYAMAGGLSVNELPAEDRVKFEKWFAVKSEHEKEQYKNPGLRNVLDTHANRLFETAHEYFNRPECRDALHSVSPMTKQEAQRIIEVAFKCLTKIDENKPVRNLMTLQEITDMIGDKDIDTERVGKVLDIYRIQGNTFLRPFITSQPETRNLKPETVLDITHEALMRNWQKLDDWAWEEYRSVLIYGDLCKQLDKWLKSGKKKEFLLSGGTLTYFEKWYKAQIANPIAWLKRYYESELEGQALDKKIKEHFIDIKEYLARSRANINRKRKTAIAVFVVISISLLCTGIALYLNNQLKKEIQIIAKSNSIATKAYMTLENDPTLSFRLAEQAYKIYPTDLSKQIIMASYAKSPFYYILRYHVSGISIAKYSPDGNTILTYEGEGKSGNINLWDTKGNLLNKININLHSLFNEDAVNFSPDGRLFISCSGDTNAILRNMQGKIIRTYKGHTGTVRTACFSPDGRYILTASDDMTARIWDINGNQLFLLKGHTKKLRTAKFSPDSKYILTASNDNTVKLWDLQGNMIKTLENLKFKNWYDANFSPDGKYIVTTSYDNMPRLWDIENDKITLLKGHNNEVWTAFFSPDGNYILTGSLDNTARLWDIHGNEIQVLQGHTAKLWSAKFSPDSKSVITISDDCTAILWNLQGKILQVLRGHTSQLYNMNFSPDGKYVITASNDKTVRIWNIKPVENTVLKSHYSWVDDASFSPDGKYIVTAGYDYMARLWDAKGKHICELKGHTQYGVYHAAFSADGKYIITTSLDNTVRLWDLNGKQLHVQTLIKHNSNYCYSESSPDNKFILTKDWEGMCCLWNTQGKELKIFENSKDADFFTKGPYVSIISADSTTCVYKIDCDKDTLFFVNTYKLESLALISRFSPDGKYFVTAMNDYSIKLWKVDDIKKGEFALVCTFIEHTGPIQSINFDKKSKYFVSTSTDKCAVIHDIESRKTQKLRGHSDIVSYADISPDGKYIVTCSYDCTIRLWDMEGNELQLYPGHSAAIVKVSFSPDGKYILSASNDQTARLMPVFVEDVLDKLNNEKVRSEVYVLSEEEKKIYGIEK